jgi:hypothetical protein
LALREFVYHWNIGRVKSKIKVFLWSWTLTKNYTINVEEDKSTGDLFLTLPVDMLNQMGWSEGTDLFWIDNHNGSFTLTDKKPNNETPVSSEDTDVGC